MLLYWSFWSCYILLLFYYRASKEHDFWTIARYRASVFTKPRGNRTATGWFARFLPFSPHSSPYQATGHFILNISVDIDVVARSTAQNKSTLRGGRGVYVKPKLISCLVTLLIDLSCLIVVWCVHQEHGRDEFSWFQNEIEKRKTMITVPNWH